MILGRHWLCEYKVAWDFGTNRLTVNGIVCELQNHSADRIRSRRCRVSTDVDIPPTAESCFRCGRPGHRQRECHLNGAIVGAKRWQSIPKPTITQAQTPTPAVPHAAYVKAQIDSKIRGADISLIPSNFVTKSKIAHSNYELHAANDTTISVEGSISVPVVVNKSVTHATLLVSPNIADVVDTGFVKTRLHWTSARIE